MDFATGTASGVVSKIGEYLAEATIKQGRYLCCFNSIVKDLQEEAATLTAAKDDMMVKVEKAKQETKIIYKEVEKWQSDASKILEEVEGLRKEIEEKKSCLSGWCPNWGCSYWLGRKATKKTIIMKGVVENGRIENVGHLAALPDDSGFITKDFEFFQSSKFVFDQIIEALKNDQINRVGLYGMGGTGKTTLANAVSQEVKKGRKMFDKVIMVAITQTPNFKDIQAYLAESLGLKLEEETEENRAKRLYMRFMGTDTETDKKHETEKNPLNNRFMGTETDKKHETEKNPLNNRFMGAETDKKHETEKKILVILDDVWESFDLKAKIGISFEGDNKGCKILLTTRLEHICRDMKCQQKTQLNVLEEEEGLLLLKKHAGIGDDPSLFNGVTTQVARECDGLPLALVTIGYALKGKRINEWENMLQKLRKSKLEDIPDSSAAGEKGIYAILKLSYDYLKGEKLKSCFLLCSLFPEDYEIDLEELLRYAIGLGWYKDADSIKDARNELLSALDYLKASSLLLDAGEEYVKMHDMVRHVALWIASKGENVFMSKVGMGQIEWSKEEDWERYTAISSINNKIEELSIGLVCPKLDILILGGEGFSKNLKVSDECFKEMKGLKVLSLTHVDLSLKSLQFLINLKTLRLSYCNTRDISYLKKLNRLEILLFYDPPFDELPKEISELCELRLFYMDKSVRIPSNVLRRCSKLEELYTLDRFRYGAGADEDTSMASIFEVISLPRLSTLHFSIDATCLPKDLAFPKLQRYVICVNTYSQMISFKRALEISNIEAVSLKAFKALYETIEYLRLEKVTGCQNILPSIDRGFNELKEAYISACDKLQEVFQLEGLCHAGKEVSRRLAKLDLENLPVLRHIWKGPIHHLNLQSLTYLRVDSCDILEHIFPISIARGLVRLEELTITNAPQLKQVFYMDHAREEIIAENDGKDIELPMLRILRLQRLESLTSFLPENYHSKWPMLEEVHISECSSLTTTSFISMLSEELSIEKCEEKENIIEDNEEDHPQPLFFPNLREINVNGCDKLRYLFPISIIQHLQQLEYIGVERCYQLEKIFEDKDGADVMNDKEIILPQLKQLSLSELPSLTNFGPMDYHFILKLQVLKIECCPKLRHVFSCNHARNLLPLEELSINDCQEMEYIIVEDNEEDNLFFPNLRKIKVNGCGKLKYLFPISISQHLQQLESIQVERCDQIEKVFEEKDGADVMNDKEIILPQLKELSLSELPSLTNFGPMGYHFTLLKELYIINCEELEQIIVEDEKNHIQTPFFPNLSIIDVRGCNKLEHLFPVNIAAGLQQLESIYVQDCDQLQKVFGHKNGADDTNDKKIVLPQLKELSLNGLPNLTDFGPVDYQFILKLERSLQISGCHQMWAGYMYRRGPVIVIYGLQHELRSLEVENLLGPQSLFALYIIKCLRLKHIFSSNLARGLLQLKELYIINCEELEQTIVEDEKNHIQTPFFPNLNIIYVRGCNKLKHLFPVNIAAGLQQLESINVQDCDQLQKVVGHKNGADDTNDKKIVLPQLKKFSLRKLPSLTDFGPVDYQFILKLERSLKISGCHQMCASSMYCQGPVIVICGLQRELRSPEVENLLGPQNLFALYIIKCLRLKHIFSSNLARDLLQLKELYIINCEELEQIIVEDEKNHIQTPFFPNLSRIDVSGCNKLEHLFPVNIAAGLKQLKSIDVQGCDQLQKVFGPKNGVDDINDEEIVLPQLETLSFKELPNLTNFGPMGYQFSMQLKSLIMEGCKSYFGDGGCEFTISGVDKSDLSCVTHPLGLGLSLCRGLTFSFTLRNLSDLGIHECHKMIHIFSSNLARNLLQLSYLDISNCEELEQIIVEDGENDHTQTLFFPNLLEIYIRACNKLKYVFPIVRGLQKLKWISVEECDQLEEVFMDGDRDGDDIIDDKEVVFSSRGILQLEKLPRLTNFCSTGYHCIFPSLSSLRVKDCPNIATRFSRGEGRSVHAECKPPNEGGKDGDQPTIIKHIYLLPPYSKGSPSSRKQNGEET